VAGKVSLVGGTPLFITGNIYVSRDGKSALRQLDADADDKIPGLGELIGNGIAGDARLLRVRRRGHE